MPPENIYFEVLHAYSIHTLECQTPKWQILVAILDFRHIGFMWVKSDDIFIFVTIKNLYNIPITEIYMGMFLCISGKMHFRSGFWGSTFRGACTGGLEAAIFEILSLVRFLVVIPCFKQGILKK